MSDLALLGGVAVRNKPFALDPMVDHMEEEFVLSAIRDNNFSRYIGANSPTLKDTLLLPSKDLLDLNEPWSFFGGPNVRHFSAEFAEALDVPYAIPVNSATTGLSVGLAAAGVGPGDEVIMPAISFSATASAAIMIGAIPVFVDVLSDTFCIDPAKIEAAITPRTKALLPVHLTGNVSDMDAIMEIATVHGLAVIEDAAQAIGAKWNDRFAGTLGDCGVFSFQQSKNIMTGEGGMIVTRSSEVARRARLLVNHGEVAFEDDATDEELFNTIGFNFRMPELCAALGRAQIRKLNAVNTWRSQNSEILSDGLKGLPGVVLPQRQDGSSNATAVPHMFVALYDPDGLSGVSRTVFVAALRAEGIPIGTGYVRTLYQSPHFMRRTALGSNGWPWKTDSRNSDVHYANGQCTVAEALLDEQFLWFYQIAHPSTADDMKDIISGVQKVVQNHQDLVGVDEGDLGELMRRSQGRIV